LDKTISGFSFRCLVSFKELKIPIFTPALGAVSCVYPLIDETFNPPFTPKGEIWALEQSETENRMTNEVIMLFIGGKVIVRSSRFYPRVNPDKAMLSSAFWANYALMHNLGLSEFTVTAIMKQNIYCYNSLFDI